MPFPSRLRRLLAAALPALLAVAFTACNTQYPNSVFTSHTENNRDVGYLFKILIYLGTFVFIFVERHSALDDFPAIAGAARTTVPSTCMGTPRSRFSGPRFPR